MPFILTSIAGLSTMLGTILIFFKFKNHNKIIANALLFAAGVMITVSLIDLIPESLTVINNYFKLFPATLIISIAFSIGVLISIYIDNLLPNYQELYRVGIVTMLAIIIHNIPEGIATYMTTTSNLSMGIHLSIAIALHNIPEGISIAIPIYYATGSKFKALFYTFISGISEVIGAIICSLFLKNIINEFMLGFLYSIIAGIMIQIAIYELIPTAYKYRVGKIQFFLIGSIIMIISCLVF